MSIASFEDLGYEVNYAAADPYDLPTSLMLAIMGVGLEDADHGDRGIILVPGADGAAGDRARRPLS